MPAMRFVQLHGCENAYVYLDVRQTPIPDAPTVARRAADPATGPAGGADGLILLDHSACADVRMHMFNADGSRGAMCGNGIRGLVKLVLDDDASAGAIVAQASPAALPPMLARVNPALPPALDWIAPPPDVVLAVRRLTVETDAGVREAFGFCHHGQMTHALIDMGVASLRAEDMPASPNLPGDRWLDYPLHVHNASARVSYVSVGNAHVVEIVADVHAVDLAARGPAIAAAVGVPGGVNVHFVHVHDPRRLDMRPWERGSGATRACGTGACAAAVAAHALHHAAAECTVDQPGGAVSVQLAQAGADRWRAYLTGPVQRMAAGDWPVHPPT